MKHFVISPFSIFLLLITFPLCGQTVEIDARISPQNPKHGHLVMGNPGAKEQAIELNNKYITIGGKPVLPIMGEVHYTRVTRERWEDVLLKMKANGINIIAFYIFWNHHEEKEGTFDWSGNKDVRAFVGLCQKHGLYAYPRLGPWCHGEVRNGGLPDWLMKKENIKLRSNDPAYQQYVEQLYQEISYQLKGLYYKDGGPIIGLQLENEYWRGKGGEAHILWLKQTAQKYGIDVPMYTITGWRSTSTPENEVIPLWGGYPAAPWNTSLKKIEHNDSYLFKMPINDQSIGNKEETSKYSPNYSNYPYLTCELGVGNQISEHRRPIIGDLDGLAIALSNLASGSNLLGYYVFAGGLNPVGRFTTLEEDRWESGYWNEYPDISYDFQAAIRETGEIAPAYQKLKPLHYFLNEFGGQLAPLQPVLPEGNSNWDDLQYSFRTDGTKGFLFLSNYYRGHVKTTKKNIRFLIRLKKEQVKFPSKPVNIQDSTVCCWPVNFQLNSALLKYATAQPICSLAHGDTTDWYFKSTPGVAPEMILIPTSDTKIECSAQTQKVTGNEILLTNISTQLNHPIVVTSGKGQVERIFVLSDRQSEQFWLLKSSGQKFAYLSTANLYCKSEKQLEVFSTHTTDTLIALKGGVQSQSQNYKATHTRGFKTILLNDNSPSVTYRLEEEDIAEKAQWLNLQSGNYGGKVLYSKQFTKKINVENTAGIRKATLYQYSGLPCHIRINSQWLNQEMPIKARATADITGYLQKGGNTLFMSFPCSKSQEALIAVIEVEYYNSDKEYFVTDSTWETIEQYKIPAPWEQVRNLANAETVVKPAGYPKVQFSPYRYAFSFQSPNLNNCSTLYLRINYLGDKAQCRVGKRLVADNFNNGTTWSINLSDVMEHPNDTLVFELTPWKEPAKVYLEKDIDTTPAHTRIQNVQITIENHMQLQIMQ